MYARSLGRTLFPTIVYFAFGPLPESRRYSITKYKIGQPPSPKAFKFNATKVYNETIDLYLRNLAGLTESTNYRSKYKILYLVYNQ